MIFIGLTTRRLAATGTPPQLALKLPAFGPQSHAVGLKLHLRSFVPFSESDLSGGAQAEPQVFGKAMLTANSDVQLLKTQGSAIVFEGVAG